MKRNSEHISYTQPTLQEIESFFEEPTTSGLEEANHHLSLDLTQVLANK